MYPLAALIAPLPLLLLEEITGCSNEATKGANKTARNPSSFFISCYTVSVNPSIKSPKSSNYFMILITSFISSSEIKRDPFPELTASVLRIFFKFIYCICS